MNRAITKLTNRISSLKGNDFSIGNTNRIGLMQMILAKQDGIDIGGLVITPYIVGKLGYLSVVAMYYIIFRL